MNLRLFLYFVLLAGVSGCRHGVETSPMAPLKISENRRFFAENNGNPFFWLGDTGWLIFGKLTREEAEAYLDDRKEKGFNVIQAMLIHHVYTSNAYGDSALVAGDVSRPKVTEGIAPEDSLQYDYWDHVDFIIGKAEDKGLHMALVPVWGSNVRSGLVNRQQAAAYATWLGNRYREQSNIIWLNGGDVPGSDSTEVWQAIGTNLRQADPYHLITFHPRGRLQSSDWFHNEHWLDFNMFQSGHRRYDQDDSEKNYGEDSWRYVKADYLLTPVKPTLDGEPSYEGIPHGLHDTLQPFWNDNDIRRYAYWSVFSGASGFTYGHSAVMQFHKPGTKSRAYGVKNFWTEAIDAPGARQMIYLKNLMLSRPYFERIPDQSLLGGEPGVKYDYQTATRGNNYAFIYTSNGKTITVNMGIIGGKRVSVSWYNPRNGSQTSRGEYDNSGVREFDPPGEPGYGNDWVLILDSVR
jgi:hypothetical protein